MLASLKQVNKVAVIEVAFGIALGIILIRLLTSIFSRGGSWFGAEDMEELEHLHGRGRARRAAKRQTRRKNRAIKTRDAIQQGTEEGSAGEQSSVYGDDQGEEAEQLEMAEMAEFYQNLTRDDIDNMSDAEYAEYAEFMENLDEAA